MIGYVYLTTNDINETVYIGKRQKKKFENWYKGSGTRLKLAFKKYGKPHFHVSVLEWCETEKDLCEAEKRWISQYRNNGFELYNIADGGNGGNVIDWNSLPQERRKEINQKNSDSHKGNKNGFYGKKHSQETKCLISKHNARRYPVELMKFKERQRSMLPKVVQYDKKTGELIAVWNNWCEASKAVSPNNRCGYVHIQQNCEHERKSAYGFRWEYAKTGWTI